MPSDESLSGVGICSYTWGLDKVSYTDKETGETWLVSPKSEAMARAGLRFFDKVWVDALCIVQCWDAHRNANLLLMAQLYWHGTVVPETAFELSPTYPLRGWVQQEVTYTNCIYALQPLELICEKFAFLKASASPSEAEGAPKQGSTESKEIMKEIRNAISVCQPYFVALVRMTEGRKSDEAQKVRGAAQAALSHIQKQHMLFGGYGVLEDCTDLIMSFSIPLSGKLPRESNVEGVLSSALESYRQGWFTMNDDRPVASFGLAAYVLEKTVPEVQTAIDEMLVKLPLQQQVTINPISRCWVTQLAPEVTMRTAPLGSLSGYTEAGKDVPHMVSKLDVLFTCILGELHSGLIPANGSATPYALGWKEVEAQGTAVTLGVLKEDAESVHCLVSVFVKHETGAAPSTTNTIPGLNEEILSKLIALVNASRAIYDGGGSAACGLPHNDGEFIRLIDLGNPFGMGRKPPQGGAPTEHQQDLAYGLFHLRQALDLALCL